MGALMIYLDPKTGCYTDGKHYVAAREIRKFAAKRLGAAAPKGRLSKHQIATYFLDTYGVNEEVA